MTIKQTLQDWETTLQREATEGNEDAIAVLGWLKKNRWLKSQSHLPPKPYKPSVRSFKPKTEV